MVGRRLRAAAARRAGALLTATAVVAGVISGVITPAAAAVVPITVWPDAMPSGGPNGLDVDPATGFVWIIDGFGNAVRKLDQGGDGLLTVGGFGTAPGLINGPGDLAVNSHGEVWITDRGNERMTRYAPDGTFLSQFGSPAIFSNPLGIAIDRNDDLLVADIGNNTVRRFSPGGALLQTYPALGNSAFGIGVDPFGDVWVSTQSGVVRKADPVTGVVELTLNVGGQLTDIEFDSSGNAYVMEFNTSRVFVYSNTGEFIESFSTGGSRAFRLAMTADDRLLVAAGNEIRVFGADVGEDLDSVPGAVEAGAPNGGDGNLDGVPDATQANVASFPSITGAGYVSVVVPDGMTLAAVASTAVPADPVPPASYSLPVGLVSYVIRGLAPGATVPVSLHLPAGSTPDALFKLANGAYAAVPGTNVSGSVVTFQLTDGGSLDADGVADGVIVDPVAPAELVPVATITSLASSVNPSAAGSAVSFTASVVAASGTATPTGSVVFTVDGTPGAPVPLSAGSADLTTSSLTVGPHLVSAAYVPDAGGFVASDTAASPLTQTVTPGPLAVLTVSPNPAVIGVNQNQTFTARGADAFGNGLGDVTTQATFSIAPNGTCTLNVCRANAAGVKTVTARVGAVSGTATMDVRAAQTITFANITAKTMPQGPLALTATASSGLPVSFTSRTPAVCTTGGTNGATATFVAPGTCTIAADQAGNAALAPAPTVVRSFTISKANQTVTFAAQTAKTITQSPVAITATASSGLPVSFVSTTPAVCSVTGQGSGSVTLLDAGTCAIRAEQPGNANYNAAASITRNFNVTKLAQTITFPALTATSISTGSVTVAAAASSGLPVSFTTTTPAVCTAGGANGATITLVAGGTCTVRASQAGNGTFNAAPNVNRNFTVTRLAQTITFPALTAKTMAASPVTVTATASSGLAVVFTTTTPLVCTPSGPNGGEIVLVAVGTCTVRATQPGDGTYNAAPGVNRSFAVAVGAQTITFAPIADARLADTVTASATASSGLPVTITSTTPAVCTTPGTTDPAVTLLAVGTCTLRATQGGSANWSAAPAVTVSFAVAAKQAQTITFLRPGSSIQPMNRSVTLEATASSGLPVTYTTTTPEHCSVDGSLAVPILSGTCTIQADQAGDATFDAAPTATRTFQLVQISQSILFPGPVTWPVYESPITMGVTATSGLPVVVVSATPDVCTRSGSVVTLLQPGTCTLVADQAGNAVYLPAPTFVRTFEVTAKQAQTITFAPLGDRPLGAPSTQVSATASSGLPVRIVSVTGDICLTDATPVDVPGPTGLSLLRPGTCTLRAIQAGDATYDAAPDEFQSFTVLQPAPVVDQFNVSQPLLDDTGGVVVLGASYAYAETCEITVDPPLPGLPYQQVCEAFHGGGVGLPVAVPANTGADAVTYTFTFTASTAGLPSTTATAVLRVVPASEPLAQLSVAAVAASPAFVGVESSYTITVANAGPDAATDVQLTSTLPATATLDRVEASQGSCVPSAGQLECSLGTVAAGVAATVTVHVTPTGDGTVFLTGAVTTTAAQAAPDQQFERRFDTEYAPLVYTDDQTSQVYRMSIFGGDVRALTSGPGPKMAAMVSPDHRTVAYWVQNFSASVGELWLVNIDGTGERLVGITGQSSTPRQASWAPDSSTIVYTGSVGGVTKAMVASAVGDPDPQPLIADLTYGEISPTYSPDGTYVIFKDSCGRPAPATCQFHRVASDGSGTPVLYAGTPNFGSGAVIDPAGEWFYYQDSPGRLLRTRVDGTATEVIVVDVFGGYWSLSPQGDRLAYTEVVAGKPVVSTIGVDGTGRRQLTVPIQQPDPAGCYSPMWSHDASTVFMHCYPGPFAAIGIYRVSSTVPAPEFPQNLGGSFRSRNVSAFGGRPTY